MVRASLPTRRTSTCRFHRASGSRFQAGIRRTRAANVSEARSGRLEGKHMTKASIDADTILKRATPLAHQQAHEIQPFGHLVRMPIALSENACKASVENLNQLLADTMTLRDLYKKHH